MEEPVFWHLWWRAAAGQDFVRERAVATRIRQQIVAANARLGRSLISFLILPGEIHMLVKLGLRDRPSVMARQFSGIVSRWMRQRDPDRRPVFGGRMHARHVWGDEELNEHVRMLAWRPVVLGLHRAPAQVPHSAVRVALGICAGEGYDCRPLLALFGGDLKTARSGLRSLLQGYPSDHDVDHWALRSRLMAFDRGAGERVLTSLGVSGDAAAKLVAAGGGGLPGALRVLERWIKRRLGIPVDADIRAGNAGEAARARALIGCLAVQFRLCSAAAVARHLHRSKATLCERMNAVRRCPADQRVLAVPLKEILDASLARNAGSAAASCKTKGKAGSLSMYHARDPVNRGQCGTMFVAANPARGIAVAGWGR